MNVAKNARMMVAGLLATASLTLAQSVPTQGEVSSPYWNRTDLSSYQSPSEATASQLVAEVPQAHATATAAKFSFYVADRQLRMAISGMRHDFEDSEEYQNALSDYRDATLRYEQAKKNALRELRESPEYAARLDLIDRLGEQIKDEHATRKPNYERVLTIASMKLDQRRDLTEAEMIQLVGNADVQVARDEMVVAYKALVAQRKQLERMVRNDSNLIDLRAAKEQALIAHVASATYWEKLRHARDVALRFAAFNKVQDRYTTYSNWYDPYYYGNYTRSAFYPIGVPTVDLD